MSDRRTEEMRRLRETGLTYGEIGRCFGVSRQRAHQLVTGYGSERVPGALRYLHIPKRSADTGA